MAIVFQNVIDSLPKDIRYKIRPRAEQLNGEEDANTVRFFSASDWRTTSLVPFWPENGPREPLEDDGGEPGYHREGFLHIQRAVAFGIIHAANSSADLNDTEILIKRYPYPPYLDDSFVVVL
ncbi:hypothetical protein CAPTEDRAFT_207166, partial [Capitella teleta]